MKPGYFSGGLAIGGPSQNAFPRPKGLLALFILHTGKHIGKGSIGICVIFCWIKGFDPGSKDNGTGINGFFVICGFYCNAEIPRVSRNVEHDGIQHYVNIGILFASGDPGVQLTAGTEWINSVKIGYHSAE